MAVILLSTLLSLASAQSWSYSQNGANWTGLCSTGTRQSPINISSYTEKDDGSLQVELTTSSKLSKLGYNSNYYFTTPTDGSLYGTITVKADGKSDETYNVDAIHVHVHSENQINGEYKDVEMHFYSVNADTTKTDKIEFVVMFDSDDDDENDFIKDFIDVFNGNEKELDPKDAYGGDSEPDAFYYYEGSGTSPGCTEDVNFVIVKKVQDISKEQKEWFDNWAQEKYGASGNYRELQDVGSRTIYLYDEDWSSYLGFGALMLISLL